MSYDNIPSEDFSAQLALDDKRKERRKIIGDTLVEISQTGELIEKERGIRILYMDAHGRVPGISLMASSNPVGDEYLNVEDRTVFRKKLVGWALDPVLEDGVTIIHTSGQIVGCTAYLHERAIEVNQETEEKIKNLSGGGAGARALMRWSVSPLVVEAFQLRGVDGSVYSYRDGEREPIYQPKK